MRTASLCLVRQGDDNIFSPLSFLEEATSLLPLLLRVSEGALGYSQGPQPLAPTPAFQKALKNLTLNSQGLENGLQ